jgi:anti-sigma regulatory factor (Ser/Thr protein kinase)
MDGLYINDVSIENQEKELLLKPFLTEKGISLSCFYDSDFKSAKILRDYIEKICETLKIENKWKSRLILITDEINNNAIEYGSLQGERNSMTIEIQKGASSCEVKIEVEDTGN